MRAAVAHERLLHHRGDEQAVGVVEQAPGQAVAAACDGCVLREEEPRIGAHRRVKPDGVVDRSKLKAVAQAEVRRQGGAHHREVRKVGKGAGLDKGIVGKRLSDADPGRALVAVVDERQSLVLILDKAQFVQGLLGVVQLPALGSPGWNGATSAGGGERGRGRDSRRIELMRGARIGEGE